MNNQGGRGKDDDPRRILLIHFGQLGDAVMALPAALALRQRFPRAQLIVLAARGPHAVFAMAGFDPIWTANRTGWKRTPAAALVGIPALLAKMRIGRFDLSVDLHSFKETNWLAFLAGIPRRCAMLRPTRSLPSLITVKPPPDDPDGRLVDRYCRVLEPLGILVENRVPRLPVGPVTPTTSLGICPGAGHPGRRWPAERFAAVAQHAHSRWGATVEVFAGPEESPALLAPLAAVPGVVLRRGLSIPQLTAALARCRLVVTNPTGPSHLAAAAGGRVLTLGEIPAFDPVPVLPGLVHPLRATQRVDDIPLPQVLAAVDSLYPEA